MRQRIMNEVKEAMKAGDKVKLGALRMIQAALKDKDIEARGEGKAPLADTDIFAVMQKMIKQRLESADIYGQANRPELEEKERTEAAIISSFLPQQMSEQEIKSSIQAIISEIGATSIKDMGKVIAALKAQYSGRMDFAKASGFVKDILSKG